MAVTFLDDSAHHWWILANRNRGGAQDMTWEEFKTLFLGQYFGHAQRIRIQSDFLNMKKRDDEGVIEFEQRFTTLSYHAPYLIPDKKTRIDMFIGAVKTRPEFHPETRGESCGDHLQGKLTEGLGKPPLKMDNPNPEKLKNT